MYEYELFMSQFTGFTSFGLDPQPIVWIVLYSIVFLIYYFLTARKRVKWIDRNVIINLFFIFYIISVMRLVLTPIEIWNPEYQIYYMRAFRGREPYTFRELVGHISFIPFDSIIFTLTSGVQWSLILRAVVGNIILLFPLSIFVGLLSQIEFTFKKTILCAFLVSFTIESVQFIINILTRWPNRLVLVDDLILNTFGAILGYWIYKKFGYLLENIITAMYEFFTV